MASINKVLEEVSLKLDEKVGVLLLFNEKIRIFFNSFEEESRSLTVVLDNFGTTVNVFNRKMRSFFKEIITTENNIKKISKKPSANLRDVASLTQRIENLVEKGDLLGIEAVALLNESEAIKEKYLIFVK